LRSGDHCIRRHHLLISEFILNEFRDALVGKFRVAEEQAREAAIQDGRFVVVGSSRKTAALQPVERPVNP